MLSLIRRIDHQLLGVFSVVVLLAGLLFSRALISIGMMGLLVNALVHHELGKNIQRFWKNKALVAVSSIFLLYLLSAPVSENTVWLVDRLRMKLPLLLLPFAIVAIPRMDRKVYFPILYGFFYLILVLCLLSLSQFFLNFEAVTKQYETGKIMWTPVQHIRFSLMVAYCVAIGWHLYLEKYRMKFRWESGLLLGATAFMVIFLHLLAVRSGLLALYGVIFYFFVRYMVQKKKYRLGALLFVGLMAMSYLAFQYIPTLKIKINYTLYSVNLFLRNDNIRELSDSRRLASIQGGLELGKTHMWTGVGVGDIRDDTNEYLRQNYPDLVNLELMPHNQYIWVFAATGLLGMLWFMAATTWPLFYHGAQKNSLIVAFHIIIFSSFLVEHTIETQLGTAFYIVFLLLGIRHQEKVEGRKSF
jgi:O-antigen ligase